MADANNSKPAVAETKRTRMPKLLLWWSLFSLILLGWGYHRQNAPKTFLVFPQSVEGKEGDLQLRLDDAPFDYRSPVPIGWHTLRVEHSDMVSCERKLFVWYGINDLGDLDLRWQRGGLILRVLPEPRRLLLIGPHWPKEMPLNSGLTSSVPVGRYVLHAEFSYTSTNAVIVVGAGRTNSVELKAPLGELRLSSKPVDSEYELKGRGVDRRGTLPQSIDHLPAGSYYLAVWRGSYRKEGTIQIEPLQITESEAVFDYGSARIESEPLGATVSDGRGHEFGKTPLTIGGLEPKRYSYRIELEGYAVAEASVVVSGNATNLVTSTLFSRKYLSSVDLAREELQRFLPDLRQAAQKIEEALLERPNDKNALTLKTEINFRQFLRNAEELGEKGDFTHAFEEVASALQLRPDEPRAVTVQEKLRAAKAETEERAKERQFVNLLDQAYRLPFEKKFKEAYALLKQAGEIKTGDPRIGEAQGRIEQQEKEHLARLAEIRKRYPREVFANALRSLNDEQLFDPIVLTYQGKGHDVAEAVRRMLAKWGTLAQDRHPNSDVWLKMTKPYVNVPLLGIGPGGGKLQFIVVIGQTTDQEVQVLAKILDYDTSNHIQSVNGVYSDDSFTPIHPQHWNADKPEKAVTRRKEMAESFKSGLDKLLSPGEE
jgi:tetratricopeptide (TPR) repeat protein